MLSKYVIAILVLLSFPAFAFARQVQLLQKNLITSTNLVSYWNFNGANSNDYKGTNNGTASNITYVTGLFSTGSYFDGTNSLIAAGTTGMATGSGSETFLTWIYPTSSSWMAIESRGNNGTVHNARRSIRRTTNGGGELDFDAYFNSAQSTLVPPLNQWSLVGFEYAAGSSSITFILNTTTQTVALSSGALGTSGSTFHLGEETDNADPYSGEMDDAQDYSRVLTPSEIARLYTSRSLNSGISR